MRITALALTVALAATPALAQEAGIALKKGPGLDAVETGCGSCHTLDYITMNSPFIDAKLWEAEVTKMIKAFGAPIEPAEAKTIIDYLVKNYGKSG